MAAVVIPKAQQDLLTRRPSRVDSLFEIPKSDTATGIARTFAKVAALVGKHPTTACSVSFQGNDILFTAAPAHASGPAHAPAPASASGPLADDHGRKKSIVSLFRRKSSVHNHQQQQEERQDYQQHPTHIARCDIRTTKVEVAGHVKSWKRNRKDPLVKLRIIDAKGPCRKIYAANVGDAGELVRAVVKERERALEGSPVDGHHYGREILDLLRERDVSNRVCADCGTANPEWVSNALGTTVGWEWKTSSSSRFFTTWEPGSALREAALRAAGNFAINKVRTARGLGKRRLSVDHAAAAAATGPSPVPEVDGNYIREKYALGRGRSRTNIDEPRANPDHERKRRRTVDVEL
ncbi:MAG: hypothetical protein BJ554DRAFT_7619 [Olpidium bornovanus]|uniref:Uncharacterized protein n=1 Tax=Olpidium bornovanus TaxID=278681 RepID=A0A8H8DIZ0_9FUNG|nr:MAG: hypothetical protein BJ554DRAFT_7619 [Olpidium bornovanus]